MVDLSAARILAAAASSRFRQVEVYASLVSTQAPLLAEGGRDGRVVVADHQTAGRGRLDRRWLAPPGSALLVSVLLREVPPAGAPLVSLRAGVAVCRAVERTTSLRPRLKWPNDVQVNGRKLCGILGEVAPGGGYVVLGWGVNVRQEPDDLPPGVEATSLALEGADVRRDDLLGATLRELDDVLSANDDWMDEYRRRCASVGMRVRVALPDGNFEGVAEDIRSDGALVVDGRSVLAGDVVHLRPA